MTKAPVEEQYPLLFFLVGDKKQNNRCFGRRSDRITSGASAVMTEWPNFISSWWLTTIVCSITLLLMWLMLLTAMTPAINYRYPRCVQDFNNLDNRTIHLVHNGQPWTQSQLHIMELIIRNFPNYTIHLTIIKNTCEMYEAAENQENIFLKKLLNHTASEQKKIDDSGQNKSDHLNNENNTLDKNIVPIWFKNQSNLMVTYMNYNEIFKNSPLQLKWLNLNDDLKIFAARVLQLWQYGGLSYDLDAPKNLNFEVTLSVINNTITKLINANLSEIQRLVQTGRKRFESLSQYVVSVDNKGLHMETKTPCHAFFGNLLKSLRRLHGSKLHKILNCAMDVYCRMGAIDKTYCKTVQIRRHVTDHQFVLF